MTDKPYVGDTIVDPFMGDDVQIDISEVLDTQPLVATDGIYRIIDQYGDERLIELDAGSWVVTTEAVLSEAGYDALQELRDGSGNTLQA